MSAEMDTFDSLTLMVPCPYCDADRGEWCVTSSGATARWLHDARSEPIVRAWRLGWDRRTESLVRWSVGNPRDFARFVARWTRENWRAR